jgi:hypothetical protein
MDCLAALRETLRFNYHRTGSKSRDVQAFIIQLLSKNPICRKQREGYFGECRNLTIFIFTEEFHTQKKNRCQRTPVNKALLLFDKYHEASRRAAAEQIGSPFRSEFKFMLKYPFLPEPRI